MIINFQVFDKIIDMRTEKQEAKLMKDLSFQLKTRLLKNETKMDVFLQAFLGKDRMASYQARIHKNNLPEFCNMSELSRYLSSKNNYQFDIHSRQLTIIFRFGPASFSVEFQMLPDINEIQENLIKLLKNKSADRKSDPAMERKLNKAIGVINKAVYQVLENKVSIENGMKGIKKCWQALQIMGSEVIEKSMALDKLIENTVKAKRLEGQIKKGDNINQERVMLAKQNEELKKQMKYILAKMEQTKAQKRQIELEFNDIRKRQMDSSQKIIQMQRMIKDHENKTAINVRRMRDLQMRIEDQKRVHQDREKMMKDIKNTLAMKTRQLQLIIGQKQKQIKQIQQNMNEKQKKMMDELQTQITKMQTAAKKSKEETMSLKNQIKSQNENCLKLQQKLQSKNRQIEEQQQFINKLRKKISDLEEEKQFLSAQNKSAQQKTLAQLNKQFVQINKNPVNKQSKYYNKLSIEGAKVIQKEGQSYPIIFLPQISLHNRFEFQIKIHKCDGSIYIGVADKEQILKADEQKGLAYQDSGERFPEDDDNQNDDQGYSDGDTVAIIVDRRVKMMKWKVNGVVRGSFKNHNYFSDPSEVIVPYACISNAVIEWKGCSYLE